MFPGNIIFCIGRFTLTVGKQIQDFDTNPKSCMWWDLGNESALSKGTLRCFWTLIALWSYIFASGSPSCLYRARAREHKCTHASMLVAWFTSLLWFNAIQLIGDTDAPKIHSHQVFFMYSNPDIHILVQVYRAPLETFPHVTWCRFLGDNVATCKTP